MGRAELENLVQIGKLSKEPPDLAEVFAGRSKEVEA